MTKSKTIYIESIYNIGMNYIITETMMESIYQEYKKGKDQKWPHKNVIIIIGILDSINKDALIVTGSMC